MRIPNWSVRITALTNREINRSILNEVAQQYPSLTAWKMAFRVSGVTDISK